MLQAITWLSDYTSLSSSTINKLLKSEELLDEGEPEKKVNSTSVTMEEVNLIRPNAICLITRKITPTLDSLLKDLQEAHYWPHSRTTLHRSLPLAGFKFS